MRRSERDWEAADALRDRMRILGWEPVDGPDWSTARPILPEAPDPEVTYASAADLASRLDEPASLPASVVLVAEDHAADLERFAHGMRTHAPAIAWELVVVDNAAGFDPMPLIERAGTDEVHVLRSSQRLGWADSVNLGLRRARGEIVVLVDTSLEPSGDWLGPLSTAFEDPTVGVAGGWGVTSGDGREFSEAPPGEVDAIESYCLALRREALRAVGGFDRRFRWYRNADLDLSFAVRSAGWRALATPALPMTRHEHRGWSALDAPERERLSKRNFYRFLDHWGDRRDLLLSPTLPRRPSR